MTGRPPHPEDRDPTLRLVDGARIKFAQRLHDPNDKIGAGELASLVKLEREIEGSVAAQVATEAPAKPRSKRQQQLDERARKRRPTKQQQADFLDLIRDGNPRNVAAAEVGATGSRFRAMCRPGAATFDAKFAEAYADACAAGERGLIDKLDELALERLADPATASDRALHNERIFRDPDYRAAHRQQGASVSVTTEMEVTNVHIAIEGARDRLVQKLAPVLELVPARDSAAGDRGRPN